ncbi:MAG TPA: ABC transporter substrate-binding protein, partial [Gammaproteobacteria bacterium]|nr:ABC transporter substrate-binding protein [Gammaproteobacteria bacterium]
DPRYDRGRMETRIPGQPWGRPFAGAREGVDESRFPLSAVDVTLQLQRTGLAAASDLEPTLRKLASEGVRLVILDLPGKLVARAAAVADDTGQLLLNTSAADDSLREQDCDRHLFHLLPTDAMRMDGLAQYLTERNWKNVLLVAGPRDQDHAVARAFRTAAKRYGLDIVDERSFVLGNDPRQRQANNLDILTRGEDFDVVFVADADGEFAQTVPYSTRAPRPVIGSAGLIPTWWHWNWRKHGAPQLNHRFERAAGRRMTAYDWSAWLAVKAITEAVLRTRSTNAMTIADYLRSDRFVLDGFQGYRLSFRAWNNQLRMAIFLATPNWVAARAPLPGFLHPQNDLDSLGKGAAESTCKLGTGG